MNGFNSAHRCKDLPQLHVGIIQQDSINASCMGDRRIGCDLYVSFLSYATCSVLVLI
jgi:hypothetical protein